MITPDKETVLQALIEELSYDSIKIGGDISAFKDELYTGFLKYLGKRKCTEKIFSNFIIAVADTLLDPNEPAHRVSDERLSTRAVGI